MENANKPINPVLTQSPSLQNETSLGLTKREYFAGLAMQGLLSAVNINNFDSKELVEASVRISDELLKQLENK